MAVTRRSGACPHRSGPRKSCKKERSKWALPGDRAGFAWFDWSATRTPPMLSLPFGIPSEAGVHPSREPSGRRDMNHVCQTIIPSRKPISLPDRDFLRFLQQSRGTPAEIERPLPVRGRGLGGRRDRGTCHPCLFADAESGPCRSASRDSLALGEGPDRTLKTKKTKIW